MPPQMHLPGAEKAVVGTYMNEYGNEVLVYNVEKVLDLFYESNQSLDAAEAWIDRVQKNIDIAERPIFIDYQPSLGDMLAKARGVPS